MRGAASDAKEKDEQDEDGEEEEEHAEDGNGICGRDVVWDEAHAVLFRWAVLG